MQPYALTPEQFAGHLLQGDESSALDVLKREYNDHDLIDLYEDIVTPAMRHVGVLWEENEITVADEHLATAVCDFVLSSLTPSKKQVNTAAVKKTMLFGIEQEQHYLGIKMVAVLFREHGWHVDYMGPDLPLSDALSHAEKTRPDVIGMSTALPYRLTALQKAVASFEKTAASSQVILGGRTAVRHNVHSLFSDNVLILSSLRELDHWIREGGRGESRNANANI